MTATPATSVLPRLVRRCEDVHLPGGLRVVVAESRTVPLVHMAWMVTAGARHEPPGLEGLASLTLPLLRAGTTHSSSERITAIAKDAGADIVPHVDWEAGHLALELLDGDWRLGLDLGYEMLGQPVFPALGVEALRRRQLRTLQRRQTDPSSLAQDALRRMVFAGSIRSRHLLGTPESLARINRHEVCAFHRAHFQLASATLVCVGSLRPRAVLEHLASLPEPALTFSPESDAASAPEPSPALPAAWLMDVAGAPSVEIGLGFSVPAADDGELIEARLLTIILSTRLRSALRERLAMTYAVGTRLTVRDGLALLTLAANVDASNVARTLEAIHHEVDRLVQEGVGRAELSSARTVLEVELLQGFQTLPKAARALARLARSGSIAATFEASLDRSREASAEDLRDLAGRFLLPERAGLVVAGPASAVRNALPARIDLRQLDPAELSAPDPLLMPPAHGPEGDAGKVKD